MYIYNIVQCLLRGSNETLHKCLLKVIVRCC